MGKSSPVDPETEIGLLKRIADNTPDMLYRMSLPDGNYEYVSSGSVHIFGDSPETLYATPRLVAERIHPDWNGYFENEWAKLLAGDMPPVYEYQIITKDGETKWVSQRNVLITDDDGKPVAIEGVVTDITSSKLAELKALESEERFRMLFENSPDPTWIINEDNMFSLCNLAAVTILGYDSIEELESTHPSELSPEFQSDGMTSFEKANDMMALAHQKGVHRFKWTHRRKSGASFPVEVTLSRLDFTNRKILYCTWRDMTEHDMLEEQFIHAQKMEALGTLVGGIAHDFNNMLAGITGNLYLAKKLVKDNPDVSEKLTNAEDLSFRAAEMIKQLLTFARKDRVNMEHFPLTSFIKEAINLLCSSIPENITIDQDICADDLIVNGDTTQIQQILLNLVNNASDALKQHDDPKITIRLKAIQADKAFLKKHPGFKPGAYAQLSVEDNGIGIPENLRARLFEPFFTTKEVGKGTGLGLAMVFGVVKNHHGFVEVDGTENEGSIFKIYLPIMDAKHVKATPKLEEAQTRHGAGETILLVDDQIDVVETGKQVLESMGYLVMTADNGRDAVALFKDHSEQIDLIVMDVVMPIISGDKAAELIREIKPDIKIIFATGYDKGQIIETKDEVVISKPYSIENMSELISKTLDA